MEPTQTPGQGNMNMGGDMNQGAPTPAPMMNMNQGGGDAMENKGIAIAARIPILFWIPLVSGNKSPFAMFHANQSLVLLIGWVASGIIGIVPVLGWIASPLLGLAVFILWIMGIVQAAQGQMKPLPIIGTVTIIK